MKADSENCLISDYSSLLVPFSYHLLFQILAVSIVAIVVVIYLSDLRARIRNISEHHISKHHISRYSLSKPRQKRQAPCVRVVEIGSSSGGISVSESARTKQRHCSSCDVIINDAAIYCDKCGAKQSDE